jgi:hypothetical protein
MKRVQGKEEASSENTQKIVVYFLQGILAQILTIP